MALSAIQHSMVSAQLAGAHIFFRSSVQPAINDPDIMGMALASKVDSQGSIESGKAKNNV
jgi:hypothetical protein